MKNNKFCGKAQILRPPKTTMTELYDSIDVMYYIITCSIRARFHQNGNDSTDPDRFWSVRFRFVFPPTKLQTRNDPTRSEAYTYFLSSV